MLVFKSIFSKNHKLKMPGISIYSHFNRIESIGAIDFSRSLDNSQKIEAFPTLYCLLLRVILIVFIII